MNCQKMLGSGYALVLAEISGCCDGVGAGTEEQQVGALPGRLSPFSRELAGGCKPNTEAVKRQLSGALQKRD